MATTVVLDGELVGPERATISVLDRGFLYGDSVYEVLRTYQGVPFEIEAHLERLEGSAARIGMKLNVPPNVLRDEILKAHRSSGNPDSYVRVIVTRGAGKIGLDPALAVGPKRIVIAQDVSEMTPPARAYSDGVEIALVSVRRNLRSAIDPQAKTGNYLNSVMAIAEARQSGAYEAVMLDHQGFITEGSSSNIFLVIGGMLLTPPIDAGILKGVTRRVVLEVAKRGGIRVLEIPLPEATAHEADEVFITSSIREVVPVSKISERELGKPGPVTLKVRALFKEYVEDHIRRNA
jgi:branched-chain amino acid aminotransferase